MRRIIAIGAVLLAVAAAAPARAHSVTGRVSLPAASPTVPRTLYTMNPGQNGTTGFVFQLHRNAEGRSYTLTTLSGATGLENLDAYFYTDIGGTGTPCPVAAREDGDTETGTIDCPAGMRPVWGVIVLRSGADARFSFTY